MPLQLHFLLQIQLLALLVVVLNLLLYFPLFLLPLPLSSSYISCTDRGLHPLTLELLSGDLAGSTLSSPAHFSARRWMNLLEHLFPGALSHLTSKRPSTIISPCSRSESDLLGAVGLGR